MKTVLLVVTHFGSNHGALLEQLQRHQDIDVFLTNQQYMSPDNLENLISSKHKRDDSKSIYCDMLLHNKDFYIRPLLNWCKFVFYVREPRLSLPAILAEYSQICDYSKAAVYYTFRLRGIMELALRVPEAPILDWSDLQSGSMEPINQYLKLSPPIFPNILEESPVDPSPEIPLDILDWCEDSYTCYLKIMRDRSSS